MKTSLDAPTQIWEEVASQEQPSWYLDALVAEQKRRAHLDLFREAAGGRPPRVCLKTDLFEDAYGDDALLPDLTREARFMLGLDISVRTACAAASRHRNNDSADRMATLAADIGRLPFASGSLEVIFSNSTLDHFATRAEFRAALAELARVLEPGGRLIVTTDNPWNPSYWPLRALSGLQVTPFPLGYTPSIRQLASALEACGLVVEKTGTLLHNPRVLSTLLFLALRRILGQRADGPIGALLRWFAACEKLPSRWFTACFITAIARKPE